MKITYEMKEMVDAIVAYHVKNNPQDAGKHWTVDIDAQRVGLSQRGVFTMTLTEEKA